jgi:hypothetical protein
MDYVPLVIILAGVSACAFAAYELFDAIERDEYERPSAWSEPPRVSVRDAEPLAVQHAAGAALADADRLDVRIRRLVAQLERLEGECDRIGAPPVRKIDKTVCR